MGINAYLLYIVFIILFLFMIINFDTNKTNDLVSPEAFKHKLNFAIIKKEKWQEDENSSRCNNCDK